MANTREIQSRMKSIQDTMKITNAMYMISSTKLRKAKKNLEETEPYFYTLQTMVSRIVRHLRRDGALLLYSADYGQQNRPSLTGDRQ